MADRYLLESGSPDGYLLEDGSGVLLIEPLASSLTDNFDDNSRDTAKWNIGALKNPGSGVPTVNEVNQRLEITSASTAGDSGYLSAALYQLDYISCKVAITGGGILEEGYIGAGQDSSNYYLALIGGDGVGGGNLFLQRSVAGSAANVGSVAYNATNHAWLRLRYDGTTIYLDVAPATASNPPLTGDWNNLFSETANAAINLTSTKIAVAAGAFGSASSATFQFDGFNTATSSVNAYSLSCATGTFTLSGQAMTPAVKMPASTGTFTLTGNAVTPAVTMPAATGALTLTGTAAALSHGYSITAARGGFTLTGNAVALEVGHVFTAATGAFALTGRAMTPAVAMSATTGSFSLTGYTVTPAVAVPLSRGTFSLSGQAAALKAARLLTGSAGAFVLTGNAAGLNKVGSSSLVADRGTFTLTGYAAALARAARISAAGGAFALTGTSAAFPLTRRLTGLPGAFTLTGTAAGLGVRFPALGAQFVLSGFAAGQAITRRLSGDVGSFVITGYDLAFIDFNPSARTYPLAGTAQPYPGTAATYPLAGEAQAYPATSAQTYPLAGDPQQYPLAN